MLLGAFAVVGVLAAIVVLGPGGVFHVLVSFLLPMAVILLVVVGTIGLMVQGGAKVLDGSDALPSKNAGRPRGPLQSSVLAAYEPLLARKRGDGLLLLVSHPRPVDTP
jgi:hypothetical protein